MDTHFDFTCLVFLSKATFRYLQSSFRASRFDTRLTNTELDNLFNEIYKETNDFKFLKTYYGRKKESQWTVILIAATIVSLLIAAMSQFNIVFFIIFIVISLVTILTIVFNMVVSQYYLRRSKGYEKTISKVLEKWNEKYWEEGIKFSLMRSFYVLMIHADYKKEDFKYNLV